MLIDLRLGIRRLLNDKGFTIIAIVSLSLGIGANTAIFSVVNCVLLRQLPFRNPHQLMSVSSSRSDREGAPFSLPDFLDYQSQNNTLDQIAAFSRVGLSLAGPETIQLQGARISANLFQMLGIDARIGRTLVAEDDEPDRRHVVVLAYGCWRERFGADSQLIGKALNLNGESYEVVGVLPPTYSLPIKEAELAIPLAPKADPLRDERSSTNFLRAVARLKPAISRLEAESDLTSIVARERELYGEAYLKKTGVRLIPLRDEMVGSVRSALWILLGAVAMVLMITCSNLAALSLVRMSSRQREISIKKALGAPELLIVRQILIEHLILAAAGGIAGVMLATWGVSFLVALSATELPRQQEIGVDFRMLAFAMVTSAVSAVAVGLLPSLAARRVSNRWTTERGAGGGARLNQWRNILVSIEVAVSFLLLIGAGLMIQSFLRVQSVPAGFDPKNTFVVRLSLPKARYDSRASIAQFCDRLTGGLQTEPGIETVAAVSIVPMSGALHSIDFTIPGRATSSGDSHQAQYRLATDDYFRAMRIPLLEGRLINEHDNSDGVPVVVINETMARRFWPDRSAVGTQIEIDDNNTGFRRVEIVGIVGNVKHISLDGDPTSDIYLPFAQLHEDNAASIANSFYCLVRSKTSSSALEKAFRRELKSIDSDAAASNFKALEGYLSDSVAPRRFNLRVLTIFSAVALLLAATGIYGIVSYAVSRRTAEIGIRLALGAQRSNIFGLVLSQGLKVAVAGVGLGTLGSIAMTRAIRSLLFGITPTDPLTYVLVSALLVLVALVACSVPARRATHINPMIALRKE